MLTKQQDTTASIRGYKEGGQGGKRGERGKRGPKILEEAFRVWGGLLGHIKAKVLVMLVSSGAYS